MAMLMKENIEAGEITSENKFLRSTFVVCCFCVSVEKDNYLVEAERMCWRLSPRLSQ